MTRGYLKLIFLYVIRPTKYQKCVLNYIFLLLMMNFFLICRVHTKLH